MDKDKEKGALNSKPLELFELPELAQKSILSYLKLKDLMALRLSCKTLNSWVINNKLRTSPVYPYPVRIAISDIDSVENEDRSWKCLLAPGTMIYRTKIRELTLTVHSETFYDDPEISTFLKIYGSSIRTLKLNQFYFNSPGQTKFVESLVRLYELKLKHIHISGTGAGYLFPKNLEEIHTLKLDEIKIDNMSHQDYPYILIEKCLKLSALRLTKLIFQERLTRTQSEKRFRSLIDFCLKQEKQFGRRKLELVNVKNINDLDDVRRCQSAFLLFARFAEMIHLELKGVSCDFFEPLVLGNEEYNDFNFITEIQGFNPEIISMLPLIEIRRVVIQSLHREIDRFLPDMRFPNMDYEWDEIESIKIHFDIKEENLTQPYVHKMSEFLFGNGRLDRSNVEHISISFAPHLLNATIPAAVVPARNIIYNCTCVTKLELINWNPANKSFLRLWGGLMALEELIIENCPSLGNVGFIGQDVDKPEFLYLRSLKKLTLKLDLMPKVTERAFKDVFRHMKLKEFILKSDNPLENIGVNAINWLLDGVFSTKIERFPFDTWSSTTIPASQMLELKSQFKSLLY